jgi:hypothetical protein
MADWISEKDRLPEPGERVLATSGKFVGEAYIDQERHWHRHYGFTWMTAFGRPVTHWCKMPEPPDEEGEG